MMSVPVILWIVMAFALAALFAYRKIVDDSVDDLVHVSDPSGSEIAKQTVTARKLEQIDRVVMILAILVVVYGLGLGGMSIYKALTNVQ
jgi:preprotein translocase subunit SecG